MTVPNLDCMSREALWAFWQRYHRPSRKDAAELIGDRRPGYTTLASLLANYACSRAVAMRCRLEGDITGANIYESHCDMTYERIPQDLRWMGGGRRDDMSDDIKDKAEYHNEIKNLAEEIVREESGDRERCYDRAHETVDGHQWIIYTRDNAQVLDHSACFDNYGPLEADSYSDAMREMAFAAMLQDLSEAIESALDEWSEEP